MTHRARFFPLAPAALVLAALSGQSLANAPDTLGRLFFTPAERAQLEQARVHKRTRPAADAPDAPPPVRYDGMVLRSDGRATHWVDGRAQPQGVGGLKPGQVRAGGKVFEPYQVVQPAPLPTTTVPQSRPGESQGGTP